MGFDGRSKGGVGLVIGGAHATLLHCTLDGNAAELGGAFYVQGCDESRSREALCPSALASSGGTSILELRASSARAHTAMVRLRLGALGLGLGLALAPTLTLALTLNTNTNTKLISTGTCDCTQLSIGPT